MINKKITTRVKKNKILRQKGETSIEYYKNKRYVT